MAKILICHDTGIMALSRIIEGISSGYEIILVKTAYRSNGCKVCIVFPDEYSLKMGSADALRRYLYKYDFPALSAYKSDAAQNWNEGLLAQILSATELRALCKARYMSVVFTEDVSLEDLSSVIFETIT